MFTEKLKERYEINVKSVHDSIMNMRSMLELDGNVNSEKTSGRNALSAIYSYYKINRTVDGGDCKDLKSIEKQLHKNNLFTLNMKLSGKWWHEVGGPVLAQDKDDNFIALLPSFTGYSVVDPITGKKHNLKPREAASFKEYAINIFPKLPKGSVSKKEFKKYCISLIPRKGLLMTLGFCILATLLNMCIPIANKNIFGEVIPAGDAGGILPVCGFLIGCSLSSVLFELCRNFCLVRIKDKMNTAVQCSLMDKLLHLPSAFFKKYSSGNLGMRVLATGNIYQLFTSQILAGLSAAVFSVMYILIAFIYAKSMIFVVTFTTIFAIIVVVYNYRVYLNKYYEAIPNSITAQDFAYNAILGIQKIKNCRAEHRAFAQWVKRFSKSEFVDKYGKIMCVLLSILSTVLAYLVAWKSHIPVSDYIAFMSAFGIMMQAIKNILPYLSNIANASPYIDLMEPLLITNLEDKEDYPMVENVSGAIDVNHVMFRYDSSSPLILDDLSLHIPTGQNVALVGKSGCGKSTLMRLLMGFETPMGGSIFYGHYDISKVNLGSLRQFIGFCPQSTQIIPGTIYENIQFSSINASEEEVWEAARTACLDEDIRRMPKQLDTMLGEGGNGLSGGQCQRLLIARAVLNHPRILFLDEATSALDNITQRKVIENLKKFGCTRIAIAHRLSTVMDCDRIIVLDKGKIIEDGSPKELMEKKGFFYELSKRQM